MPGSCCSQARVCRRAGSSSSRLACMISSMSVLLLTLAALFHLALENVAGQQLAIALPQPDEMHRGLVIEARPLGLDELARRSIVDDLSMEMQPKPFRQQLNPQDQAGARGRGLVGGQGRGALPEHYRQAPCPP